MKCLINAQKHEFMHGYQLDFDHPAFTFEQRVMKTTLTWLQVDRAFWACCKNVCFVVVPPGEVWKAAQ